MSERVAVLQPVVSAATTRAAIAARLTPIDALRGVAMLGMALDHAAHFVGVGLQAETYGGMAAQLASWPYWTAGLFTNLAAPVFWTLSGVSAWLYAASRERKGGSQASITRFLLIRAAVLIVLDLTICSWFWRGNGPYLHVLLSIGTALALLALLRLLGTRVVLVAGVVILLIYQSFIDPIAAQFSQAESFLPVFLIGYSTLTRPAVEFSILGWFGLMAIGYGLGPWFVTPAARRPQTWLMIGAVLLGAWALLRLTGLFGDLVPFAADQPLHFFLIMGKTPPTLTYFTFNLGVASLLMALLWMGVESLTRPPLLWLTTIGQVALFFFVAHIVVYSLLSRVVSAEWFRGQTLPALAPALLFWMVGLAILVPLCTLYRRVKRNRPDSVFRYL